MQKILSLGGIIATVVLLGAGCNINKITNTTPETINTNETPVLEETTTPTVNQADKKVMPEVGYGSAGDLGIAEIEYYDIATSQNLPNVSTQNWLEYDNNTYGYKFVFPAQFNCMKEPGSLDCEIENCKQAPAEEYVRPEMVVRNRITCQKTCDVQAGTLSCTPSQVRIVTYEKKVPVDMQKFCTNFYNIYNNTCLFEKLLNVEQNETRYTYLTKSELNNEQVINDYYYIVPDNSKFMYQIGSLNATKNTNDRAEIEQMIKNIKYQQ